MRLFLHNHATKYKAENIIRLFFPDIELCHGRRNGDSYIYFRASNSRLFLAIVSAKGRRVVVDAQGDTEQFLYAILKEYTGETPPWGMLCGVRPLWLYRQRIATGLSPKQTMHRLEDEFDVSPSKALLLKNCYETQQGMDIKRGVDRYSLYLSIPYCPSRCRYCSFISMATNSKKEIGQYVAILISELKEIAAEMQGTTLETIYIGGGTPTVLEHGLLQALLNSINELFPHRREFTVEAGRPDCTDREKLRIIKQAGVDRISINPQTFCDDILKGIGRHHTADDVRQCFYDARQEGLVNINMDLIAGLPGDNAEGFLYSLKQTLALNPESITVHSFTKKSGSMLSGGDFAANPDLLKMMIYRDELLEGYNPYYIYRQKKTPANLENVGYAKPGFECLYNVYMMDELHTVVSAGAGGVTKYVQENRSNIKRKFHPKYPAEYIAQHGKG